MPQHTNTVAVALGRLRYRDALGSDTLYSRVLAAVESLAEHGHTTVTAPAVADQLHLAGLSPKGNTVYRTLHRLSDPRRFEAPPLVRAGRGRFRLAPA